MISTLKEWGRSALSITASLTIMALVLAVILVVGLFAVSWLSTKTPEHYVCKGTYVAVSGEDKTRYPQAQLGLEFVEPTWFGEKVFGREPTYEYALHALPTSANAVSQRDSGHGLSYSELTSQIIYGDKVDKIFGRTLLSFERLNGYVGLSNRKETDALVWGFDFDGFCEQQ